MVVIDLLAMVYLNENIILLLWVSERRTTVKFYSGIAIPLLLGLSCEARLAAKNNCSWLQFPYLCRFAKTTLIHRILDRKCEVANGRYRTSSRSIRPPTSAAAEQEERCYSPVIRRFWVKRALMPYWWLEWKTMVKISACLQSCTMTSLISSHLTTGNVCTNYRSDNRKRQNWCCYRDQMNKNKKLEMVEEIIFGNLYDTHNKTESVVIVLKVLLMEWGYLSQAKIVYRSVSHHHLFGVWVKRIVTLHSNEMVMWNLIGDQSEAHPLPVSSSGSVIIPSTPINVNACCNDHSVHHW